MRRRKRPDGPGKRPVDLGKRPVVVLAGGRELIGAEPAFPHRGDESPMSADWAALHPPRSETKGLDRDGGEPKSGEQVPFPAADNDVAAESAGAEPQAARLEGDRSDEHAKSALALAPTIGAHAQEDYAVALAPALFGRWNWWMPAGMDCIPRVPHIDIRPGSVVHMDIDGSPAARDTVFKGL